MRLLKLVLQRPKLEMMRIVRDLTLTTQSRYSWHSHSFIVKVHLFKLYPHIHHLLLCVGAYVVVSRKLSQIVFMYAFFRIIALKVEVLHLKLPNPHLLVIENTHI